MPLGEFTPLVLKYNRYYGKVEIIFTYKKVHEKQRHSEQYAFLKW